MRSALAYAPPRVATVLGLGGEREEWDQVFDEAHSFRHDDATQRLLENMARQDERERKLPYVPISSRSRERARSRFSGGGAVTLSALFRRGFFSDIGGVPGVSDSLFDADYYSVDGVSGKVSAFVDYIDAAHTLAQAASGSQVAVPSNVAAFGGAKGGAFLGATVDGIPDYYVSTRTAAAWNFLVSGAGSDLALTFSPTDLTGVSIYLCTITGAAIRGVQIYGSTTTPVYLTVAGSSGNVTSATPFVVNAGTHIRCSYLNADAPKQVLWQGGTNVGSASPTPTASDGERPLTLAARDAGSSPARLNFRTLTAHQRRLNSAERAVEATYTTATTGIAVVP